MFAPAYMAKRIFQCFHSMPECSCCCPHKKSVERASPHLYRPCTLGRTWGTHQAPSVRRLRSFPQPGFGQHRAGGEGNDCAGQDDQP